MKIILLQDVPGTGRKNEIKEISDGYAKNYLLPKKLAKPATETAIRETINIQKKQSEKREKEIAEFKEMAKKINGLTIKLPIKVNNEGIIFGSVGTQTIVKELSKFGLNLQKEQIKLISPIKTLGLHNISIIFKEGIESILKVNVIKE